MAIAAYGFQLAGAPRLSIVLLIIAWLVISISLYRHNLFEGKSKQKQITGHILIPASLAAVFIVVWVSLQPTTSQQGTSNATPSPSISTTPDWKASDESKRISSEMQDSVQKLIEEGKAIDVTDVERATKAYADWADRCSATMGKIDIQMKQVYGRETNFKTQCPNTQGVSEESKKLLKVRIEIAVNHLTVIQISMPFYTLPDASVIRLPLSKD